MAEYILYYFSRMHPNKKNFYYIGKRNKSSRKTQKQDKTRQTGTSRDYLYQLGSFLRDVHSLQTNVKILDRSLLAPSFVNNKEIINMLLQISSLIIPW